MRKERVEDNWVGEVFDLNVVPLPIEIITGGKRIDNINKIDIKNFKDKSRSLMPRHSVQVTPSNFQISAKKLIFALKLKLSRSCSS